MSGIKGMKWYVRKNHRKIPCIIPGCERISCTRGHCSMHYHRVQRGCKDLSPEIIKNKFKGKSVETARDYGRRIYQKTHKIILPTSIDVHHIDHNPFNNDPKNLYPMVHAEHARHHHPKKVKQGRFNRTLDKLERALFRLNNQIY